MPPTEEPRADQLETFANQFAGRDYTIEIVCPEFTSVCPKTGQPDFGTLTFTYTPAAKCVELKSLKLYFVSFRQRGIFYEAVINEMLEDLVSAVKPRWMEITGEFSTRGGLHSNVVAKYTKGEESVPTSDRVKITDLGKPVQ